MRRLVLCTTSGGVDVASLGATDWRPGYRAEMSHVPDWFVVDRTDITARLPTLRAPTLVLYGDQDPLCPEGVARFLASRIPARSSTASAAAITCWRTTAPTRSRR